MKGKIIEFIEPLSNENARLVNQGGLFTRSPAGMDVESWVKENFPEDDEKIRMWKLLIPEKEIEAALRDLFPINIITLIHTFVLSVLLKIIICNLRMYKNNSRDSCGINGCSPLQLSSNLTGNYHTICHYSYNLPLPTS